MIPIRIGALLAVGLGLVLLAVPSATLRAAGLPGVPVLMYHRIDPHVPADPVGRSLTIDPVVFAAQLAWLRLHHIRTLTMEQLAADLAHGRHPRHAVVLTFDDGYADEATWATPLLRSFGDRASFYVSEGFIGDGRHVSWKQLRMMRDAGMEIGCHGTDHLDLSRLDRAAQEREIGRCVDALTRYVGRPVTYAYPAGKWNALTLALMRKYGLEAALTERPGTVASLADRYELPRRRVARGAGLASFAALATP